jgi:hypothetical protein
VVDNPGVDAMHIVSREDGGPRRGDAPHETGSAHGGAIQQKGLGGGGQRRHCHRPCVRGPGGLDRTGRVSMAQAYQKANRGRGGSGQAAPGPAC